VQLIFGSWDVWQDDGILIIVEGEINALSIWQVKPSGVSVASIGGQANGRPEILRGMAGLYSHVLLWIDDPQEAKRKESAFGRPCFKMQSPIIDGKKHDANEVLKIGQLPYLLDDALKAAGA